MPTKRGRWPIGDRPFNLSQRRRYQGASTVNDLSVFAGEAEQVAGDFPDLDILRTFRDAITAMVAVDVLKWLITGITLTTKDLHGTV